MNINITDAVKKLLDSKFNKFSFCNELGISRPTLDRRLELHNWKKSEIVLIKILS